MRKYLLAIAFLPLSLFAQEKTHLFGIGHSEVLDTYLSQEHYTGLELRYTYSTRTPLKRDSLWTRGGRLQVLFSTTSPRSSDATDLGGIIAYSWGMQRQLLAFEKGNIAVGAQVGGFFGGLYNTRNGNNPAQLKAGIELSPTWRAEWNFCALKKNLRLAYQGTLPIMGAQFSPNYGQSYYEIFAKNNYDGNICFTHVGNALSYTHQITIDIPLGKRCLTVGYLGDYRQSELHELKFHSYTNAFLIGFTL